MALAVAQRVDSNSLETIVGLALLAAMTGLSERSTRTHVRSLVNTGWLNESTASRGRAHWQKSRRLTFPHGFSVVDSSAETIRVAANISGTQEVPADFAGTSPKSTRLAANNVASAGKKASGVPANSAAYLVDLSRSDLGAASPVRAEARSAANPSKRARAAPSPAEVDDKALKLRSSGISVADIVRQLSQYGFTHARYQQITSEVA